jgi:hypothetical protein
MTFKVVESAISCGARYKPVGSRVPSGGLRIQLTFSVTTPSEPGAAATIATNCCDWSALRSTFAGTMAMASGVREIVALAESVAVLAIRAKVCAADTSGGAT